jgi:peptide/nickel transport system substrate-binding protein
MAPDESPDDRPLKRVLSRATWSRRALMRRAAIAGAGTAAMAAMPSLAEAAGGSKNASLSRQAGDPTTLVIAMDGSPSDLDPHSAYDYRSVLATLGAYEGLIGLKDDKTDEFVGLIAESWTPNADQSTWTFTLRDGITFQDGSVCDAAAVVANYERLYTLGLGALGVVQRFIPDWKAGITAPDAKTVVFSCGRPQPLLPTALASTYAMPIVNVAAMKTHDAGGDWGHTWAQTNAVGTGTGPYRITSFTPDDELVMEKYDGYWGGWDGAHFDKIILRVVTEESTRRQLLELGDADIVDSLTAEDIEALRGNTDLVVLSKDSTVIVYMPMTVSGPLASIEARQAMCYAFPYQDVIDGVYKGNAKIPHGGVADTVRGYAPETFQYTTDLDKAKQLFAAAGVAAGTELTVSFETGSAVAPLAAQLFQNNLAQIGITLKIDQVDLPTFTSVFYGDTPLEERPNLFWWYWWPDYNDAYNHLYPQIDSASWGSKGANAGFYKNDSVDQLLATAGDAPDTDTYTSALAQVQQIISKDDPPAVYYAQPLWTTVYRKDVQGVVFNPINLGTYNFWKMSRSQTG